MIRDDNFALRASWREYDVPDSEAAALLFENNRLRASIAAEAMIDRAIGILMGAHRTDDSETIERLLRRVSASSRLRLADLAQAVVEVACGATEPSQPHAAQVVTSLLLRPAVEEKTPPYPPGAATGQPLATGGEIDLRGAEARGARDRT